MATSPMALDAIVTITESKARASRKTLKRLNV